MPLLRLVKGTKTKPHHSWGCPFSYLKPPPPKSPNPQMHGQPLLGQVLLLFEATPQIPKPAGPKNSFRPGAAPGTPLWRAGRSENSAAGNSERPRKRSSWDADLWALFEGPPPVLKLMNFQHQVGGGNSPTFFLLRWG